MSPFSSRESAANSIASSIERLNELSVAHADKASTVADQLRDHSERLEQEAAENEPPEPDYDYDSENRNRGESVVFDILRLFSEL